MRSVSPVLPGLPQVIYAENQHEYLPLPAYRSVDGVVVTRWRLSLVERLRVLIRGDIYLSVLTFNQPLQPVKIETEPPDVGQALLGTEPPTARPRCQETILDSREVEHQCIHKAGHERHQADRLGIRVSWTNAEPQPAPSPWIRLGELWLELGYLLSDEDLTDERLREASEGLLPNIFDTLKKVLPRPLPPPPEPQPKEDK
ncbi:MAG: hypothetical protein L0387_24915 [Acidobacteria bacterium]|nr:hypothetical protein [Acidobacteriota bacterium]